eukprot:scaffold83055_cov14-Tisochrysis_lutea.AAC.1
MNYENCTELCVIKCRTGPYLWCREKLTGQDRSQPPSLRWCWEKLRWPAGLDFTFGAAKAQ